MLKKKVLIAEDDPQFAEVLKRRCQGLGLEVDTSPNGLHAWLGLVLPNPPDLVILDLNMPFTDGLGVCEKISSEKSLSSVPIIVVTGRSDEATIQRCKSFGARVVTKGPDAWAHLRPMITELLAIDGDAPNPAVVEPETPAELPIPPAAKSTRKILSIDDDPAVSMMIKMRLRHLDVEVIRAFTGEQGFWMALKQQPDVIVTDYIMPDGNGDYLLGRLRGHPLTQNIPVIVVTGKTIEDRKDFGLARQFTNLGAVEFLTKPLDLEALMTAIKSNLPGSDRRETMEGPAQLSAR